ncbi:MAG: FHIPEP family type III secretion protein [Treponema sp.]|nr:FHIPEP family type III secretion protein [Treponema sp.]
MSDNRIDFKVKILAVAALLILLMIPIPVFVLETMMALNIIFAIVILLTAFGVKKPADFYVCPTLIVISVSFSMITMISATRSILVQGERFGGLLICFVSSLLAYPGGTVRLAAGFAIFAALIAVQVLVITKGAVRMAEVAACFTLDAMPGKQMTIDSELENGTIGQEEHAAAKKALQREVDLYGAMDGAVKFVSGTVKFGVFNIILIILGGIIIGVSIHGKALFAAMGTYTSLAVGSGLLFMLPSFLVCSAIAVLVARAASDRP